MAHKQLSTWQKATALVPLALLSGAWTANLTMATGTATATENEGALPDGTAIPDQAIEAPASVSRPGEIAPGVPAGAEQGVVSSSSTNGIPSAALAAYQRAAEVINSADSSCRVTWQLIAAIGRVESDHGRYGGNRLDDAGRSVPGIFGIPLDGNDGTAKIRDTDAGQYDDDQVYDRAVGPMQFIPSTWSVVGVDADGDDVRDPQDIDDAALATAVYLCSGDEDLSTLEGQRTAVYRYNHSQDYVDLVLSIMNAYLDGDYSPAPNGSVAPTTFSPAPSPADRPGKGGKRPSAGNGPKGGANGSTGSATGGSDNGATGGSGGGNGGSSSGADSPDPAPEPSAEPTKKATKKVQDTVEDTTKNVTKTVVDLGKAVQLCTAELQEQYGEAPQEAVDACAQQLVGKTLENAQASVGGVVAGLDGLVADLLGGLGGLLDGGSKN